MTWKKVGSFISFRRVWASFHFAFRINSWRRWKRFSINMVAGVFSDFNEGGVESSIRRGVELDPNFTKKVVQPEMDSWYFGVEWDKYWKNVPASWSIDWSDQSFFSMTRDCFSVLWYNGMVKGFYILVLLDEPSKLMLQILPVSLCMVTVLPTLAGGRVSIPLTFLSLILPCSLILVITSCAILRSSIQIYYHIGVWITLINLPFYLY